MIGHPNVSPKGLVSNHQRAYIDQSVPLWKYLTGRVHRVIRTPWSMRTLSNLYQSFQYGVRRVIRTHGVSQRTRLARQVKLREGQKPGPSRSSSMGVVA
eukprot:9383186-Ditylum_brightwellii.AAC.1